MKRLLVLLLLAACSRESSSADLSATTSAIPVPSAPPSAAATEEPAATEMATASAIASATAKTPAIPPSSLPFCKSNLASEPLQALCAMGDDFSKAHFECKSPLPVNFCQDLSVWGCQYLPSDKGKMPRFTYQARFVRPGVALREGEMIDDNSLRARFPRAGVVRGVTVQQRISSKDEGLKVAAAETKKLIAAGCALSRSDFVGSNYLDCGGWQAHVWYIEMYPEVLVDADMPTSPVCN